MLPFLAPDLLKAICDLLSPLVKAEVMQNIKNVSNLLAFDPDDPDDKANHVQISKVDIGFAANRLLQELKETKHFSDLDCHSIRVEDKSFLQVMVNHLIDKTGVISKAKPSSKPFFMAQSDSYLEQ